MGGFFFLEVSLYIYIVLNKWFCFKAMEFVSQNHLQFQFLKCFSFPKMAWNSPKKLPTAVVKAGLNLAKQFDGFLPAHSWRSTMISNMFRYLKWMCETPM